MNDIFELTIHLSLFKLQHNNYSLSILSPIFILVFDPLLKNVKNALIKLSSLFQIQHEQDV